MNAPLAASPILLADVQRARAQAAATRTPLMDVLQEQTRLTAAALVQALSSAFRYRCLTWLELSALSPAFDRIDFAECARRECVAVRDGEGVVYLVLSNPYDAALLDWAEANLQGEVVYALAHRLEISAYLAKQEESMRAIDAAPIDAPEASSGRREVEELSLQHIAEADSPVVRLVNSTL